ncbi:phosphate signaling complex protein PhoU [Vibrio metschnikovii]|uniref:phosphate signaling complex protein PhoU n=1 Tax=Vibrio metschnikovii TaxID=28172 RepID=UPI0012ADC3F0
MPTHRIDGHTSHSYNSELRSIVDSVVNMGDLVIEQVRHALNAFMTGDTRLAKQVIENDHQINLLELSIDQKCVDILVKRQPAARDLRAIFSIMKAIMDLERIGDQSKRIASAVLRLKEQHPGKKNYFEGIELQEDEFEQINAHVINMLQKSMDAFHDMNAEAALEAAMLDKHIDNSYSEILRQNNQNMLLNCSHFQTILEITWIGRAVERIGDHARNVCEYTIYFVKGLDVRHKSDQEMAELLAKKY